MISALVLMGAPAVAQGAAAQQEARPEAEVANPVPNLNITPHRIVLDSKKRTGEVLVFNQGNIPVTVDVALVDNVMLPNGSIVPVNGIDKNDAQATALAARLHSASQDLLATPSRLTLAPGQGKTIRLRGIPEDGAGETRTHLTVTSLPSRASGLTAQQIASGKPGELSFNIQTVFGISIPVIMRSGPAEATAQLSPPTPGFTEVPVEGGSGLKRVPALAFTLSRGGDSSIYGNLTATARAGRRSEVIGFIRGIGVYPEISSRNVVMALGREPRPGETITVRFTSDDEQLPSLAAEVSFVAK